MLPYHEKRIALVTDFFLPRLGGIEAQVAGLAGALARAGHSPEVITVTPGDPENAAFAVRRLDVAVDPWHQLAISPLLRSKMAQALASGGFDVVHAHATEVSPVALAAVLAARRLNLPCVLTFHSYISTLRPFLHWADAAFGWTSGGTIVSAVSNAVARQVQTAFRRTPCRVIPNGIDYYYWRSEGSRHNNNGDIHAVSSMRLNWKKRPLELIAAFDAARRRMTARRIRLTIAGEGSKRRQMEKAIQKFRCSEVITLAGRLSHSQLRALFQMADFFVLASKEEAFGLAALEARCAGLPVVAMRNNGTADFLDGEQTRLLAGSDADFAAGIVEIASDDNLRARLSLPDQKMARFDWPNIVKAHEQLYADAALAKSAAPA